MIDNPIIQCACGCGKSLNKFDKRGRERKFLPSHWSHLQINKKQKVICEYCGKELERQNWHIKRVKHYFCSMKCTGKWRQTNGTMRGENNGHYHTIEVPCSGCGKLVSKAYSLIMRRNNRVYCDQCIPVKLRKGRRGFYVGYPKEFSASLRYRIRKRDKHICQECGRHQNDVGTLHVHHIDYDKYNNNELNLISLCLKCHPTTNWAMDTWKSKFQNLMKERFG